MLREVIQPWVKGRRKKLLVEVCLDEGAGLYVGGVDVYVDGPLHGGRSLYHLKLFGGRSLSVGFKFESASG